MNTKRVIKNVYKEESSEIMSYDNGFTTISPVNLYITFNCIIYFNDDRCSFR